MTPHCPACGESIWFPNVKFTVPFRCPACTQWLCVPQSYGRAQSLAALVGSLLGSFLLGLRGLALIGATILGCIPVLPVVIILSHLLFPPRLKRWSEGEEQGLTFLKLR